MDREFSTPWRLAEVNDCFLTCSRGQSQPSVPGPCAPVGGARLCTGGLERREAKTRKFRGTSKQQRSKTLKDSYKLSKFSLKISRIQDKFDHDKGQKSAIFGAPPPLEALHWIFAFFIQYLCTI